MSQAASTPDDEAPPRPRFFVDRSLGRIEFPRLLREAGVDLVTLAEHYGIPQDQEVDDVTWLAETARRGWIVVAKDARIRRRPAERETIRVNGARCFYFTRGDLPARVYADRFLHSLRAIERACEDEGPFVYVIHPTRISRMPS